MKGVVVVVLLVLGLRVMLHLLMIDQILMLLMVLLILLRNCIVRILARTAV